MFFNILKVNFLKSLTAGIIFLILSYPGLFKNIPHVWFLRLYSFLKNLQYDFPKMRGGSKAVWNFSENSSVLVGTGFPKMEKDG